jgi:hypothetical protein
MGKKIKTTINVAMKPKERNTPTNIPKIDII